MLCGVYRGTAGTKGEKSFTTTGHGTDAVRSPESVVLRHKYLLTAGLGISKTFQPNTEFTLVQPAHFHVFFSFNLIYLFC